ncbi:MAG: glycerophosphodiester phosphodiesterase [Clostridiales bacterium]|nr:glycerophosphodiester phosphodiesterase [Clostridiales bacterium]
MAATICAHRGASGYAPENTLEAFQLAVDLQADGVELDVQLTRDHELLVIHDERIDRVSDGMGFVADMTLRDIRQHTFNKTHPEYEGAKAPTLREVFDLLKPTGLYINIELKNTSNPYPGLEEKCLELAAKCAMEDLVVYSSFNHPSMVRMKSLNPRAVCGLLYSCVMVRPWAYGSQLGADALHPHHGELVFNRDLCQQAHALGLKVNTWTVNNERSMRMVLEAGADMLITDYPDRARAVLLS